VIPQTLTRIIDVARREGVSTEHAAIRVAERRIAAIGALRRFHLPVD
jgi:valine dehydrogenase (NAD+)